MDELLHTGHEEAQESGLSLAPLRARLTGGADALRARLAPLRHKLDAATAGGRRVVNPLHLLAAAAVLGVAAVVGTVYTPSYVVSLDGVPLGTVTAPAEFEAVVNRVESRATGILGYDYDIEGEISYAPALTERDSITPIADFETYLFDQIGEVMKSYVLTVDGQFIGAAQDRATLDAVLEQIKAAYTTENTVSAEFTSGVYITHEYTASDVNQDPAAMLAALTANTNGQTVYEVQAGDTFMQIALDNGMTVSEMSELNPDVDINVIYIGQLLNVKEEIPFLSVKTVDNVTYTEEIACPVVEVEDDSMYQGESRVIDAGVPGEQIVNADIAYLNGVEQERTVLSTQVTREATNKVVAVGTKVRPSWYPTGSYIWPLPGYTPGSAYGWRIHPIWGDRRFHAGEDIAAPSGTPILAADSGLATVVPNNGNGYGNYIIINHGGGRTTLYAHMSAFAISNGQSVTQGQVIGYVGSTGNSTGPHLHFETRINGATTDPKSYFSFG